MLNVSFQSLNQALEEAANDSPNKGITVRDKKESPFLSYEGLYQKALLRAAKLEYLGLSFDNRVILALEKNHEFAITYFAILLCGCVPCVVPPLSSVRNSSETIEKLESIAHQINASFLICNLSSVLPALRTQIIELKTLNDLELSSNDFEVKTNELAIIQASSGTTGTPKCILLSQRNVLANAEQTRHSLLVENGGNDVAVNWAPFYHDMGLLGCFIYPLCWQIDQIHLTPFQFLRRPMSWLTTISEYRGSLCIAPNFAYKLVTQKASASELKELDLSSWRSAMCGAEQINFKTLSLFAEKFSSYGFNINAYAPCYGLAEATLGLSRHLANTPLIVETLSKSTFVQEQRAELVSDNEGGIEIVSCGIAELGTKIKIQDIHGTPLEDGFIGEIWASGPSIMMGYIGLEEENRSVLSNGWLNTGDLGYLRDGQLFVTGRKKEIIVVRGHNYMPTEFEWAAQTVEGVESDKVVAFGLFDDATSTEQVHIVFSKSRKEAPNQTDDKLINEVKAVIAKKTGVMPFSVSIVPKSVIKLTTSGKLQRSLIKRNYLQRQLTNA